MGMLRGISRGLRRPTRVINTSTWSTSRSWASRHFAPRSGIRPPSATSSRLGPGRTCGSKVNVKRQKAGFDKSDPGLDPKNAVAERLKDLAALKEQGRVPEAVDERLRSETIDGTAVIDGRRYGPLDKTLTRAWRPRIWRAATASLTDRKSPAGLI